MALAGGRSLQKKHGVVFKAITKQKRRPMRSPFLSPSIRQQSDGQMEVPLLKCVAHEEVWRDGKEPLGREQAEHIAAVNVINEQTVHDFPPTAVADATSASLVSRFGKFFLEAFESVFLRVIVFEAGAADNSQFARRLSPQQLIRCFVCVTFCVTFEEVISQMPSDISNEMIYFLASKLGEDVFMFLVFFGKGVGRIIADALCHESPPVTDSLVITIKPFTLIAPVTLGLVCNERNEHDVLLVGVVSVFNSQNQKKSINPNF
jgi:hypothetical protein